LNPLSTRRRLTLAELKRRVRGVPP
jgi:hypothetical protein